MQSKFIELREEFSKELEELSLKSSRACWDFYINSTEENMMKYEALQEEYSNLFKNRELYEEFLKIDKEQLSKHEQKQLKDLLREFDEELNTGDVLKALRQKENEIAQKNNAYVPEIDGKEVTKTELVKILQTEENPDIRKKAYQAKIKGGDLISEDMVEFVKMRNTFAQSKGYKNYFEYKLNDGYDVDEEFLASLINEVYSKAFEKVKDVQNKKYVELKEFFGIENLEAYHYGLLLNSSPSKAVNKVLETQDIVQISKNMYKNMGYDVDKLVEEGKLTLDLYPRKGKNTHGFCFDIEAGKDARILANLTNNVVSLDTLNHEMGHCVYDLGISTELTFLDKTASSPAITEAVAMMMGDIIKKEDVLANILTPEILEKFKNSLKEDEVNFVSRSLLIIDFEREFYNNPEQNPAKLWKDLKLKYLNRDEVEDNEWATIPHYISHPAYYQNYFRANLMKVQIYNYLYSKLGEITKNNQTALVMDKEIFECGASIEEYDLIKQLTGREFTARDFIESI